MTSRKLLKVAGFQAPLAGWSWAPLDNIDAHLVFLYFVGDANMNGPSSKAEWAAAIQVLHEALGIRGRVPSTHVHDVFIDVAALR
jgi:hypothetical protein